MKDFSNIVRIALLVRRLDIDTKIIRVRRHSQENQLFKYKKELSSPPKESVGLARANLKGQPIFYGAVFSDFCISDTPRLTCLFEASREVLDDYFVGKLDLTYSLWINKREINLFVIPVFDSYPHPAKDFEWYFELWKKLMKDNAISEEQIEVLKELSRHFSFTGEWDKEQNSYAYTADFTARLLKDYPDIDGIMYPSARLKEEGIGVNVAIRPEVIDNFFELKACTVCRYFKRNKKKQLILNYKHSRFRQNGKIYYVIDREFYRDLDLKNAEYNFKTLQFKYEK